MSSKRRLVGRVNKARQQETNVIFQNHSCQGKRDYGNYTNAVEHVAGILRSWFWIRRSGQPTDTVPDSWNMIPYRCGFGDHIHMGHPNVIPSFPQTKVRRVKLDKFRYDVVELIAIQIWPEVKQQLDLEIKKQLGSFYSEVRREEQQLITEAS